MPGYFMQFNNLYGQSEWYPNLTSNEKRNFRWEFKKLNECYDQGRSYINGFRRRNGTHIAGHCGGNFVEKRRAGARHRLRMKYKNRSNRVARNQDITLQTIPGIGSLL